MGNEDGKMSDKRKSEILQAMHEFDGSGKNKLTSENLAKYCETHKIEDSITPEDILAYRAQVREDEILAKMIPEVCKIIIDRFRYPAMFSNEEEMKVCKKREFRIRKEIIKLLEEYKVAHNDVEHVLTMIQNIFGSLLLNTNRICGNRVKKVLQALSREKFGGEMTMADVATYSEENFEKDK